MATIYGFRCDRCNHVEWSETTVNGLTCPACKAGKLLHDIDVPFGSLDAYAWPGGYPIYYYPHDGRGNLAGDVLCWGCAQAARDAGDQPHGMTADIYYEGPSMSCDECGGELDSAYGDPDAKEEV